MGNVQSLTIIGAIALFSLISIRFNGTVLENSTVEVENKVYLTAFSLADDLIEEIKQKAFDEQTVVFRSINPEELTAQAIFGAGKDAGESTNPATFDDIDDYNGFSRDISLPHAEGYHISSIVNYVETSDPEILSSVQTFFKRVEVTVSSPYLRNTIKLSFIFTLHSK